MVTAYAHGLRGRHDHWVRVLPQMKHFLGYNHELHRSRTSASMSVRALNEYQAVPYRKPVEAGAVLGAMTAYNLVNGVPAVIGPMMEELRREWAPGGFMFLPDGWDAVNLHTTKGEPWDTWEVPAPGDVPYPASLAAEEGRELDERELGVWACGLMLKAGQTNFADGSELPLVENAAEAVRRGLFGLTMADADRVVRDWLTFLVLSGRLDGDSCPYNRIEVTAHPEDKETSRELALRAAREQLVLLENDSLLPLGEAPKVAVLGPLSDLNLRDYYSPLVPDERRVTPLEAIRERLGTDNVIHHRGNHAVAWRSESGYVTVDDEGPCAPRPTRSVRRRPSRSSTGPMTSTCSATPAPAPSSRPTFSTMGESRTSSTRPASAPRSPGRSCAPTMSGWRTRTPGSLSRTSTIVMWENRSRSSGSTTTPPAAPPTRSTFRWPTTACCR
ncbi:hypothetical protein GCM10029992_10560 [Glycomyces albus]